MSLVLAASLLAAQAAAPLAVDTPSKPLTMEQQTAVRCSVAFALAAQRQKAGAGADPGWPDLSTRGREYFVRTMAQLMDETGVTRSGLAQYIQPETAALEAPGQLEQVMPSCLVMLEASGL